MYNLKWNKLLSAILQSVSEYDHYEKLFLFRQSDQKMNEGHLKKAIAA